MKYISLTLLILTSLTFAQFSPGAKQISLANSDVALSNDVFALFNNPAGLSQMNWREIGVYYSPAPFGITELANAYIAFNEPFDFGNLALGGMTYGFEIYRESKISAAYSYNYQNKFFVGASINFHTVSIQNYGSDNAFYLNIGGLAYLTNDFRLGFSFHNINRASFGNEDDQIPVILNSGISYDLIPTLTLNAAIEKDIKQKASFMFGVDYDLIEYLSLRTGFSNEPSRFSAGIGINYSLISLDYAMFTHNDLGLTHQVGIIITFDKNGNRKEVIRNHLEIK
ncbi:Helix-hairpin-helix DNA-binding class 1 [Ignavibacterium album JCM 16511]|uniref:Helix-hairpin-helix DNA-binding class 1 n=1 Tax=Ignavibacterium album (strain DSM 19864 / JCM 16511 / NBRC 101810 / Mat9-16) TaxID=945713 RepID=I0AK95_IGNAJ|nr:conjugal transfer protein TraF [Ignavibacterium album]AFH49402.1 Helix-hairpin-helix DNA-binding class 1 [Ignavibacterium album JCM 16511]